MSVKKEDSGRRSIQVEVEVPGSPEEVWQAIATGPGISSWFVPTEFEERRREARRGDVELRSRHGVPLRGDGLGSAADVRQGGRRLGSGLAADRDRVERRSAGGRRLRRPCGAKPLRQHGRLGQPTDWCRIGLARLLPHPADLSHALPRPALRVHAGHGECHGNRSGGLGDADRGTGG